MFIIMIFLINSLSIITDTLNYHYLIEHTRKRLKEGVGGGSVLLQLHGMVETSEVFIYKRLTLH